MVRIWEVTTASGVVIGRFTDELEAIKFNRSLYDSLYIHEAVVWSLAEDHPTFDPNFDENLAKVAKIEELQSEIDEIGELLEDMEILLEDLPDDEYKFWERFFRGSKKTT